MKLPWRTQLEILMQTTVFITTEGSSSFRAVFLPPGASVIMLGHPDSPPEPTVPMSTATSVCAHLRLHRVIIMKQMQKTVPLRHVLHILVQ